MTDSIPLNNPSHLFPIGERAKEFKARFFKEASNAEWSDWHWQLRHRIKDLKTAERVFKLSEDERTAIMRHTGSLPLGITPYYCCVMDLEDPNEGLRRTHIPVNNEYVIARGESIDPLAEDEDTVVEGLVHRYPDRVLFLVTGFCATYCRYCTRSRVVGGGEYTLGTNAWEKAFEYLREHKEVRDVLISGGDPLNLLDSKLEYLLSTLRSIKHIEFIRIGTKIPAVMPMRINKSLMDILKKYKPWISTHFTHPNELTEEVKEACGRLADCGLPLGSQTVLMKGINDSPEIMKKLMQGLLMFRVRPYYIYQCDPVKGTSHFKTPVSKGVEIIQSLRGHTTGYAVPTYVVDAPGGGGKIPMNPDYVVGREDGELILKNYANKIYRYPDDADES